MYYYIVNPVAGNRAIEELQPKLQSQLNKFNINGEFAKTTGKGDAAKLAEKAVKEGYKTIVAVGGDDTVNEVISALHKNRAKGVAVGLIPLGGRNVLAGQLGIFNWNHAVSVLATRRLINYRLNMVNDQVFMFRLVLKPAENDTFKLKLTVDDEYELRAAVNRATIQNLRFINQNLENRLHLKTSRFMEQSAWQRINPFSSPENQRAVQLLGEKFLIRTDEDIVAEIDGSERSGRQFMIKLTDHEIPLITERNRQSN